MNNHCVICLSVYNNEFGLPYCIKNINTISDVFDKLNVIIFYDNSTDKSLSILNDFKNTSSFDVDIIINTKTKSNSRTENIAYARNSLLDYIKSKYLEYEYFIMMDTNEYSCIGDINKDLLMDIIHNPVKYDYDALSFDREAGYYDTWALSFDPFVYSFFHITNWRVVVDKMRKHFNMLLMYYKNNKPDELIPVYSAFNGFCIYKIKSFYNCSYSSDIDISLFPEDVLKKQMDTLNEKIIMSFKNDCEHRKFHLEAIRKNDAKIRICTKSMFAKFVDPPKSLRGPA